VKRLRQLFDTSLIDRLSLGAAQATVVILIIMMLFISVEVLIRAFGTSTRIAHEYSGYLLVAISFWAAAEVLRIRKHIRITVLTGRLNSKIQSILDKVNYIIALILVFFLLWAASRLVVGSYGTGMLSMGVYQIPIFIPQLAIPIGLFFFLLQIAADLFKMFRLPKNE